MQGFLRTFGLATTLFIAGTWVSLAQSSEAYDKMRAEALEKVEKMSPQARQAIEEIAGDSRKLAAFLRDTTVLTYSPEYGTQIENLGGYMYTQLWFPGNTGIVGGSWKTVRGHGDQLPLICFKYPTNSIDPVTKTKGGRWECTEGLVYLADADEIVVGNPLGLSPSGPPFVLKKSKTTIEAVMKSTGITRPVENKKTW